MINHTVTTRLSARLTKLIIALKLTLETRKNITYWRHQLLKEGHKIVALPNCSETTVWEVLRQHHKHGEVTLSKHSGWAQALNTADTQYIYSILLANPTLYLDEIQEQLWNARGVDTSITTLSCALNRMAQCHKSVSKRAAEWNKLLRATRQAEYGDIPAEYFMWLDKSSVDDKTISVCEDGWVWAWHVLRGPHLFKGSGTQHCLHCPLTE